MSDHWEFSYRTLSSVALLFLRMLSIEVNNNVHALFILSSICRCFLLFVLLIALRERWDDLVIKFIFCFFLTSKQIKTLVKLSDLNQEKQPEQHKSLILWRKKEKEKPGSDFIIEHLGRCEIITENNETNIQHITYIPAIWLLYNSYMAVIWLLYNSYMTFMQLLYNSHMTVI